MGYWVRFKEEIVKGKIKEVIIPDKGIYIHRKFYKISEERKTYKVGEE